MNIRFFLILIIFTVLAFHVNAQSDTSKPSCSTVACHGSLLAKDDVHPAAKSGCDKCHESNGQTHPQKDVKGFKLVDEVPNLCFKCHDEMVPTMKNVHPPVKNGKCLECHNPHSTQESYLIKKSPVGEVCYQCHKLESAQRRVKHEPVKNGECNKCHDPHQSDGEKLLVADPPKLCLKCHKKQEEMSQMPYVHPPFENNCLNCHNQHSSVEDRLLKLPVPALCYYCHEDMQRKVESSSVVHGALTTKNSCINCHSPHASDQKKFLIADTKKLCLSCHDKTITASPTRRITNIGQTLQKSKVIHKAIDSVGCTGCHDPHATNNPSLLKKAMPFGSYAPAQKDNFALCFQCHKAEILNKDGASSTGFRSGDKNLHYVHVNGEKGRNCVICHNPHGSVNDHLINEKTQFSSWEMPLKYIRDDNGGSCTPGCHGERKYERVSVPKKE